jgi:hypothetical protein
MATTSKMTVAMATRVEGKDEGDIEGNKSNGNGDKEGNHEEEGDGKQ